MFIKTIVRPGGLGTIVPALWNRDPVLHGETLSCLKACLFPIIKSKNRERKKKRRRAEGCLYDILIDQFCW